MGVIALDPGRQFVGVSQVPWGWAQTHGGDRVIRRGVTIYSTTVKYSIVTRAAFPPHPFGGWREGGAILTFRPKAEKFGTRTGVALDCGRGT